MDLTTQNELIQRAQANEYLEVDSGRVRYHCNRLYEDDFTDPEEQVRAAIFAWLILERGYANTQIGLEVTVPRRTPSDRADIVVYEDEGCMLPYLVVEVKPRDISEAETIQAIEQVFGNTNSLRGKYALFDNLEVSRLYDVASYPPAERHQNLVGTRGNLSRDYGRALQFRFIAGGSPGMSDIGPVDASELESRVRRVHGIIWAGGMRDPLASFNEWSKLIFAKIHDERHTPNGITRRFQVGANETAVTIAQRIRVLYQEARNTDPSVFSESIDLPDEKIHDVVQAFEHIGLTLIDADVLGTAFEAFFGTAFRGNLGQYFTPRPLVRFTTAMLSPEENDIILDPTAGTGGFLLEALFQVWGKIDAAYVGQPEMERRKFDFAQHHLFGIEINPIVGRVCQTNLLVHRDGHTNIEVENTCLNNSFRNSRIDPENPAFTLILGNPPFGDEVEDGDTDRLGSSRLSDFVISEEKTKVASELVVLERAIDLLTPGGRLGMVVPDGVLNNPGEQSNCPAFRRMLLKKAKISAVISLPDHAFRKQGAQNKTSLLFCERFTEQQQQRFDTSYRESMDPSTESSDNGDPAAENEAIRSALNAIRYRTFFGEAQVIGYTATGMLSSQNDLYSSIDRIPDNNDESTILGQFRIFQLDQSNYLGSESPSCIAEWIDDVFVSHESHRLDPKYHLFKHETRQPQQERTTRFRLGEILEPRREPVVPHEFPDEEFLTLTLTQGGVLKPREAGIGNNPPAWFGVYFKPNTRWFRARCGDLIISRIDLHKGCVSVIPDEFDGAIVTQEFPLYRARPEVIRTHYLKLLLRTRHFRNAINAVTTGHSNRRRTQDIDFQALTVFLPQIDVQDEILEVHDAMETRLEAIGNQYDLLLTDIEHCITGESSADDLIARWQITTTSE